MVGSGCTERVNGWCTDRVGGSGYTERVNGWVGVGVLTGKTVRSGCAADRVSGYRRVDFS